jgi:ribose/xylose/arabinose/galactoside ABC-type transport system permease subunit
MGTTTVDQPTLTPVSSRIDWTDLLGKLGPVIGLLFVFALFASLRPRTFATPANAELMLRQTAVVGTAALGMTLIIISGGIDLSVGANIALATVAIATLLLKGYPATVAALGGVAISAVAGLLIGALITTFRLSPFIVTLGMWGALRGIAKWLADNQAVYPPLSWRQTWLSGLLRTIGPDRTWMLVPVGVWLMIVCAVLVALLLRYTRLGRHVFAVGSNEQTARLCGVRIDRVKLIIYVLAGAFAGLAGILEFSYISMGDPTTRMGAELDVIAAVVIGGASLSGGQGSVAGSLVGALIMTMVANGCTRMGWPNYVQEIVTGGIIVFAVALDRLRHRRAS